MPFQSSGNQLLSFNVLREPTDGDAQRQTLGLSNVPGISGRTSLWLASLQAGASGRRPASSLHLSAQLAAILPDAAGLITAESQHYKHHQGRR